MKKSNNTKTERPRLTAQNHEPSKAWIPLAAFVITGLISYVAYELCSHIPAIDLASTGSIHIFG